MNIIFLRRIVDILISLAVLLITSPILIAAAIAIKLDSRGPVFFLQNRTGLNGKNFKIVKFRGMVTNALEIGPMLTQENDPRITRVGRFLRRTSIDEIPNFINVLRGDMSIVGPRPEIPEITSTFNPEYRRVFNFKPGVTGYSQVNGRQKVTPEQRCEMEIEYYSKATLVSDFKIILKTFKVVVTNDGNI